MVLCPLNGADVTQSLGAKIGGFLWRLFKGYVLSHLSSMSFEGFHCFVSYSNGYLIGVCPSACSLCAFSALVIYLLMNQLVIVWLNFTLTLALDLSGSSSLVSSILQHFISDKNKI